MGVGGFFAAGLVLSFLPRTRFMQTKRLEKSLTNRCLPVRQAMKTRSAHITSHFQTLQLKPIIQSTMSYQTPIVWEMPEGSGSSTIVRMEAETVDGIYINIHDSPIFSGTDLMFHIFRQGGMKFAPNVLTELRMLDRFFRQDIKSATDCFHAALRNLSRRRFRKLEHLPVIIIDNFDKLDIKLFNSSENSDLFWNFVHVLSSTKLANIVFVANSGWYSKVLHDVVFAPARTDVTRQGNLLKERSDYILKTQEFVHLSLKAPVTPGLERFVEASAIPPELQSDWLETMGSDVNALCSVNEMFEDRHLRTITTWKGLNERLIYNPLLVHSWQKFDNAFKLIVEELATIPDMSEERIKLIGQLDRLWKLLSLLLEQKSIKQWDLEDTLFAGHALDLHLFASKQLIFIGLDLAGDTKMTVSFCKEIDMYGVQEYMDSPRYTIVLDRLRHEKGDLVRQKGNQRE